MTSVIIPNSITSIGSYAFAQCRTYDKDSVSLTRVTIGESVTSIGNGAFYECTQLESINIPNSVTYIGEAAFQDCYKLNISSISESLISIEENTFKNCNLSDLSIIPNSITSIGKSAFEGCNFKDIILGENVTSIGERCFSDCSFLENVDISNSVTTIGNYAFDECPSLKNVTIGESVTSIGKSAFYGCESLTNLIIPNSVINLGEFAFKNCKSLRQIELGNQLTKLERGLFENCYSLESITIPGNVTHIEWMDIVVGYSTTYYLLFGNCKSLREMRFLHGESELNVEMLCLDSKYGSHYSYWPGLEIKNLYIDRKLAFNYNSNNSEVSLRNVRELTLGSHVSWCSPYLRYCENLEVINSYSLDPPYIYDGFSTVQYMNAVVRVPQQALDSYQQDEVWKIFWNIEGFEYDGIKAETISMNFQSTELNIGESVQLEATVLPEDTTDKTLEWKSSNDDVAIVDESGLVTAIGVGSATIMVTCGNAFAQCEITVLEENGVEDVTVSKKDVIGKFDVNGRSVSEDYHGLVIVRFSDGTYKKILAR